MNRYRTVAATDDKMLIFRLVWLWRFEGLGVW